MSRRIGIGLVLALALLSAPAAGAVRFNSGDGLTVTATKQLDPRLLALTVTTSALPTSANVRILLPTGYAAHPHKRYPVLYLLHGTSGAASDWTTLGGAEQTTAGLPLIVVMPDIDLNGDGGGWCTTWPDGRYSWDTFHIEQLIPWVQANLRTRRTRGERAIAGLSQGGFCSMSYASRFPELFGVALAYSGAPDIAWDPAAHLGAMAIINATEVGLDHVAPNSIFGNPLTDFFNWADHDPATLAGNLRWTKLYMYFGTGANGPYDKGLNPGGSAIESLVNTDNIAFENRLKSLDITPVVYDPYGGGTHTWPYWARDLRWSIGPIMADFAHPAPTPATFSYETGNASYVIYGWSVAITRKANEFSTLTTHGGASFTLQGSGSAIVTTPAHYKRNENYTVQLKTSTGTTTSVVHSSPLGALTLTVPLGSSDTVQQDSLGGPPLPSPGTTVYTTTVTITPAAG